MRYLNAAFLRRWAAAAILAAIPAACGAPADHARHEPATQQTRLRPVTSEDLLALIRENRGDSAVLVNIWATWCAPCVEEFPYLVALRNKYPDRLRVLLVSADFPEQDTRVLSFLSKQGVEFETYLKTGRDDSFFSALSQEWSGALPATFVYNRNGEPVGFWEGAVDSPIFERYAIMAIQNNTTGGQ